MKKGIDITAKTEYYIIMTIILSDRIQWKNHQAADRPVGWPCFDLDKDGNEIKPGHSFKFKVSMLFHGKWYYYGAKRTVINYEKIDEKYVGSSEDKEYREIYARAEKVIVEILDYGTKKQIGYGESKLLRDNKASELDEWFNHTSGGGTDTQGYKLYHRTKEVYNDVFCPLITHGDDKGKYDLSKCKVPTGFIKTDELKNILDNGEDAQTRLLEGTYPEHVLILRDETEKEPKPEFWSPVYFLMPPPKGSKKKALLKKYQSDLPIIMGTKHTAISNVTSINGIGLNTVEIPFEIWGQWKQSQFRTFGNMLNKKQPRGSKIDVEPDSDAQSIIEICQDENLYVTLDGKEIEDVYHDSCEEYLREQNWVFPREVRKIQNLAQTMVENNLAAKNGENNFRWDEQFLNLKDKKGKKGNYVNKDRRGDWEKKKQDLKDEGFDSVIKISYANFDVQKIQESIERDSGSGTIEEIKKIKRVAVCMFFHNSMQRKAWNDSKPSKKDNLLRERSQWNARIELLFSHHDIETILLPIFQSESWTRDS